MTLIADALLIAGALGAGLYCLVLSARLRRFSDLEKGVGGAVAVLSAQVDDLKVSLESAQTTAAGSVNKLADVSSRAELASQRLELLMASLHDLPEPNQKPKVEEPSKANPFFVEQGTRRRGSR